MKVLLTDDSAFMRAILKSALKEIPGIEFMEAENGDVAIELYRQYRFDVVLLDIIMPVKNGIMALEEIRQINPLAKVIIVTSVSQDEMVGKAQDLRADAFLAKPFQPQQIRDVVNQVLNSSAAPPAPAPAPEVTPPVAVEAPLPVAPPVESFVSPVEAPLVTPAPVTLPQVAPVPEQPVVPASFAAYSPPVPPTEPAPLISSQLVAQITQPAETPAQPVNPPTPSA